MIRNKNGAKTLVVVLSAVVLLTLFLIPGMPKVQAAEKEITLASVDAFSGPFAAPVKVAHMAVTLYLEETGNKIGPFKVKHITRDTELSPQVGVRRLHEVIASEKPLIVMSGASSAVQLAMIDVIGKTKYPIFWTTGWDTRLTGEKGNRYGFRWHSPNYTIVRASLAAFLDANPKVKKVIASSMDYAWGHECAEQMKITLQERNIELLKIQWIPVTATDVSPFIIEAKASGADAYIQLQYGNLFPISSKQIQEFGLKKMMKIFTTTASPDALPGIGCEALEGMYLANHWDHTMPNDWTKKFATKFKKRWNQVPTESSAAHYLQCQLFAKILSKTGKADPKVIIPELENIGEYEGPCGKEKMAGWNHQVEHPYLLLRGKPCSQIKQGDDFLEVVTTKSIYPKQGDKGFEFDRRKEPL